MTTPRIEVNLDGYKKLVVFPDHAVFAASAGAAERLSLGRTRNVLVAALHAVDTMLAQNPVPETPADYFNRTKGESQRSLKQLGHQTAPGYPSPGAGAAAPYAAATEDGEPPAATGGCGSVRCSGGCRLPSSPISCGQPLPADPADVCDCGCQYTNLGCCCARV